MNKITKHLEKALRINRHLEALELEVVYCVNADSYSKTEFFCYLASTKGKGKKSDHSVGFTSSIDEIIEKAKVLNKPTYTELKKVCVDTIGMTLYLNKEKAVVVKSILNKTECLTSDDEIVQIKDLYIKE